MVVESLFSRVLVSEHFYSITRKVLEVHDGFGTFHAIQLACKITEPLSLVFSYWAESSPVCDDIHGSCTLSTGKRRENNFNIEMFEKMEVKI